MEDTSSSLFFFYSILSYSVVHGGPLFHLFLFYQAGVSRFLPKINLRVVLGSFNPGFFHVLFLNTLLYYLLITLLQGTEYRVQGTEYRGQGTD